MNNTIEVRTNGQYKNIDITEIESGSSIVVEKLYATANRTTKESKFEGGKPWVCATAKVKYGDDEVSFFLPKGYNSDGEYIQTEIYADEFDAVGGEGDQVRITYEKGIVSITNPRTKKKEDVVAHNFKFEKVE